MNEPVMRDAIASSTARDSDEYVFPRDQSFSGDLILFGLELSGLQSTELFFCFEGPRFWIPLQGSSVLQLRRY